MSGWSFPGVGKGALEGRTGVRADEESKVVQVNRRSTRNGVDRLTGRYLDISKPLIHADVLPQSNPLNPFELVDLSTNRRTRVKLWMGLERSRDLLLLGKMQT
jgi:hypothetical protein